MTEAKTTKSRALATYEAFQGEIREREREIAAMLPRHVSKDRFINSAIAAVKQNPDLLKATPRSLMEAITKSAQDGLLPDGREGVITVYREKQKDDSYLDKAQWNPMTFGLRKRGRELDGILVDAQIVCENDRFVWHQGDEPRIEHEPAPLGQPRGAMIGVYAIWRDKTAILHREVMDSQQIEAVRGQSKSPNGVMWTKFSTEAWRKTVVRRGFKTVPCSEHLQTIVQRDDDLFAFEAGPEALPAAQRQKAHVIQPPVQNEKKPLPPVVGKDRPTQDSEPGGEEASGDGDGGEGFVFHDRWGQPGFGTLDEAEFVKTVLAEMDLCTVHAALGRLIEHNGGAFERLSAESRSTLDAAYERHAKALRRAQHDDEEPNPMAAG